MLRKNILNNTDRLLGIMPPMNAKRFSLGGDPAYSGRGGGTIEDVVRSLREEIWVLKGKQPPAELLPLCEAINALSNEKETWRAVHAGERTTGQTPDQHKASVEAAGSKVDEEAEKALKWLLTREKLSSNVR